MQMISVNENGSGITKKQTQSRMLLPENRKAHKMKPQSILKPSAGLLMFAAVMATTNPLLAAPKKVALAAGSVDGLAAALAAAGAGGTVIVKAGLHVESGSVLVTQPVSILGESGAVLVCGTSASPGLSPFDATLTPVEIRATLNVKGTHDVTVRGLQFRPPAGQTANCAVLIEDAPRVRVAGNSITEFQFGVVVQRGDDVAIIRNTITASTRWLDPADPITWVDGIDVLNGRHARVIGNVISGAVNGFMGCAEQGELTGNTVSGCLGGIEFCKVPDGWFIISGRTEGGRPGGTRWVAVDNVSKDNYWMGYVLTDGSNHNLLINNAASNNGLYDMQLFGDTTFFNPLPAWTPTTHDNIVISGSQHGLVIKDCGNNDVIVGGVTLVDHNADLCF